MVQFPYVFGDLLQYKQLIGNKMTPGKCERIRTRWITCHIYLINGFAGGLSAQHCSARHVGDNNSCDFF